VDAILFEQKMKLSSYIFVFVVLLASSGHAQTKPQPSEDFSASITSSLINGTEHVVAKGYLYVNFGSKRKLDLDLQSGKETLLDRFDEFIRYTIANNTCLKQKITTTPNAMWAWLKDATSTGKCALEDQNGAQWTASYGSATTLGCFQDDIPIQLVIIDGSTTYMLVFATFDPSKPDDDIFEPPSVCETKPHLSVV